MAENISHISWPGWETTRLIGRGSFGAVYEIQRDVFGEIEKSAMKIISIPQNNSDIEELYSDGYDEESITSTFQSHLKSIVAEYTLMRKMNGSANIVSCDDVRYVQHEDGIGWDIFIKMELLTPLSKVLPADINEDSVIKIAKDMCTALELCSEYNIVHRDIKPQNIFVSKHGDYKLGDFGIAKTIEKTTGGTKIGTYKYMAPEVYNSRPYGKTADIYSLGLVLYWLLNERRMPFLPLPPAKLGVEMEDQSRTRRFSGEPLPPPAHGSEKLKRIVLKACAYDPKDRYQSAAEMLAALNGSAKPEPPKPEPLKPEPPKPEPSKPEPLKPEPPKPEPTKPEPAKQTFTSYYLKEQEKKKQQKRTLTIIVCAILVVVLIFGGKTTQKYIASGTDGNMSWTLMRDGLLTISGQGIMPNYTSIQTNPWHQHRDLITSVVVENNVTRIGANAFSGCINLVDVQLPQSLSEIGEFSFHECSSLQEITIPNSVTTINHSAFRNCRNLKNITFPSSLIKIGMFAFAGCDSLTNVSLPDGVTTIGNDAFSSCRNLESIYLPNSITNLGALTFYRCASLSNISLPTGLTQIQKKTFQYCNSLVDVIIPEGVTIIESLAFDGCGLDSITIPRSVTQIDYNALGFAENILYAGTKQQWKKIDIAENNIHPEAKIIFAK